MADTILTIANRALQRLGTGPITSLTTTVDTSTAARVMSTITESTRRMALRSHRWNFAETRCTLPSYLCAPVYGFSCAYSLPTDYITVLETDLDEQEPYRIETFICLANSTCAMVLVTDSACAPSVTYTFDNADVTKWDPLFTYAYELQLTVDAAYAFGRSGPVIEGFAKQAEMAWRKARSRDGQEGRPKRSWLSNDLIRARLGRGRRPDQVNFD